MKFETKVINRLKRTRDVLSIRFERPDNFNYFPGQFLFLTIKANGKKLLKHFTMSSSPSEKDFIEITKRLTGHEYSNALMNLKRDDKVTIDAPYGDFTFNGEFDKVLFLTGGIGITPIRSILCCCIDYEINSDIVLLYSCKDDNNIPFKKELDSYQDLNPKLKVIYTVTHPSNLWTGNRGRITVDMIREFVPDYISRFSYISGSPLMVDSLEKILLNELNVSSKQVKKERFIGL